MPDRAPKLSKCPRCGGPAHIQWFNDELCFAACINDHCPLFDAEFTKWTAFDKEDSAVEHWNAICQQVKKGHVCPECLCMLFMEKLEDSIYHCFHCHTINRNGKPLTKDETEVFYTKYGIEVPE